MSMSWNVPRNTIALWLKSDTLNAYSKRPLPYIPKATDGVCSSPQEQDATRHWTESIVTLVASGFHVRKRNALSNTIMQRVSSVFVARRIHKDTFIQIPVKRWSDVVGLQKKRMTQRHVKCTKRTLHHIMNSTTTRQILKPFQWESMEPWWWTLQDCGMIPTRCIRAGVARMRWRTGLPIFKKT